MQSKSLNTIINTALIATLSSCSFQFNPLPQKEQTIQKPNAEAQIPAESQTLASNTYEKLKLELVEITASSDLKTATLRFFKNAESKLQTFKINPLNETFISKDTTLKLNAGQTTAESAAIEVKTILKTGQTIELNNYELTLTSIKFGEEGTAFKFSSHTTDNLSLSSNESHTISGAGVLFLQDAKISPLKVELNDAANSADDSLQLSITDHLKVSDQLSFPIN